MGSAIGKAWNLENPANREESNDGEPEGEYKVYPGTATDEDLLEACGADSCMGLREQGPTLVIEYREHYLSGPDDPICQKILALPAELEAKAAKKSTLNNEDNQ